MYLELEMANERKNQMLTDAANYRLAKEARGTKAGWRSRLFKSTRWGRSHARSGQLM